MSEDTVVPPYDPTLPSLPAVNLEQLLSLVFVIAFILWTIFTVISAYHWLRYGHKSSIAIPALITHVIVSFFVALYAASGFIAAP